MPPKTGKQKNVGASTPGGALMADTPSTEAPHEAPAPMIGKLPGEIAAARFLRDEERGHYLELENVAGQREIVTRAQTYFDLCLEAARFFLKEQADQSTIRTVSV